MLKYKCHKVVKASPMNRLEYNNYRGWVLPENENGSDEGIQLNIQTAQIKTMKNTMDIFHGVLKTFLNLGIHYQKANNYGNAYQS